MNTFHSRQTDHDRHARKNENTGTLNFTSQIAPSICIVIRTKRFKRDATIFKSRCSRTVLCYRFDRVEALPLIFIRLSRLANSSPTNRWSPARRSRNYREPARKNFDEMSRSLPHNFPAIAGRWKLQCRRISARVTRETTRNLARNCPAAACHNPSNKQCNIPRNTSQDDSSKFWHRVFNHDANNYEHINHNTRS
jgi:hypothetical protein